MTRGKFLPRTAPVAPAVGRSVWLIYLYSVLAAASISKLLPIAPELEHHLGASPQGLGFAISLLSVSSIFAATIGGAIIDRMGARPAIIITSLIVVVCNVLIWQTVRQPANRIDPLKPLSFCRKPHP